MTTYMSRKLYGGAITVDLPQQFIDGSDLRQIPSHQELFLSPTTLTSVIIEINQRIPQPDESAVLTHFADPVEPSDTSSVETSGRVDMAMPSLSSCSAYQASGEITSYESDRPVHAYGKRETSANKIRALVLVVRIEANATDLCIRINVPLKELDRAEALVEAELAQSVMEKIIASLDVKDFGLFVD